MLASSRRKAPQGGIGKRAAEPAYCSRGNKGGVKLVLDAFWASVGWANSVADHTDDIMRRSFARIFMDARTCELERLGQNGRHNLTVVTRSTVVAKLNGQGKNKMSDLAFS
jgi:hypothetical protein